MYSKEQISTRLRLGTSLTTAELTLVVRSLCDEVNELRNKINSIENNTNEQQLSTDRRTITTSTGKDIQATPIQSGFKL